MIAITASGSLPSTDFRGALSAMREIMPRLLPWPELPDRGVESAMIGHALGLIDGLNFDLQPAGWRLTNHSDRLHRRAKAIWRSDLDDAEELLQDFAGEIKVGVAGPWTLSASVERPAGDRLLADHGARRELAAALVEGVCGLVKQLAKRLPSASVHIQLDEPLLPMVRAGKVATASGFSKHRPVSALELSTALAQVAPQTLHCCGSGDWMDLAKQAAIPTVYPDARYVDIEQLASWVDQDGKVILGVVDTARVARMSTDEIVERTRQITREIGIGAWLTLAPACGLAKWNSADISWQLRQLRAAADPDLLQ